MDYILWVGGGSGGYLQWYLKLSLEKNFRVEKTLQGTENKGSLIVNVNRERYV